ncbi:POK18 protein, partial [Serilophus lunatus]|nr:POK18 protein [Serilophus lunatus]
LTTEKLEALNMLVEEQLKQGHLEPSTSPWNMPVFVVKKKSGKWRLLHNLRKVNAAMESMGALQPGMPTMIPRTWGILIIDLKDCFFTIPLHPNNAPKFAFSVPSVNIQEPYKRYQWTALLRGMKNSPTLCQMHVARGFSTVWEKFPQLYCYHYCRGSLTHYMDDILVASPTKEGLLQVWPALTEALEMYGLQIAPEKIQMQAPWKYLGVKILDQTIQPQVIQINRNIRTLNGLQKLLGSINWVCPYLGLTTSQLAPLFQLLKGDPDL